MVISYVINQAIKIFWAKLKKGQYRACLAITSEIEGTSREQR